MIFAHAEKDGLFADAIFCWRIDRLGGLVAGWLGGEERSDTPLGGDPKGWVGGWVGGKVGVQCAPTLASCCSICQPLLCSDWLADRSAE